MRSLIGPNGPVDATPEIVGDGASVQSAATDLDMGTEYQLFVRSSLAPDAKNLPATGPPGEVHHAQQATARGRSDGDRGRRRDPASPASFRPMYETSTIRLVLSEQLDPRTGTNVTGSVELFDTVTRMPVPATVIASGVHIAIDPKADLTTGTRTSYGSAIACSIWAASCSPR